MLVPVMFFKKTYAHLVFPNLTALPCKRLTSFCSPCMPYADPYQNEIRIVQASLLGSILANLLLILGMCFLIGGLRFREQVCLSRVDTETTLMLSDLQQHCHANECMSTKLGCHESTASCTILTLRSLLIR
jgi:hypothetical protein